MHAIITGVEGGARGLNDLSPLEIKTVLGAVEKPFDVRPVPPHDNGAHEKNGRKQSQTPSKVVVFQRHESRRKRGGGRYAAEGNVTGCARDYCPDHKRHDGVRGDAQQPAGRVRQQPVPVDKTDGGKTEQGGHHTGTDSASDQQSAPTPAVLLQFTHNDWVKADAHDNPRYEDLIDDRVITITNLLVFAESIRP